MDSLITLLLVMSILGIIAFHLHMYIYRPEEYAARQQRKHEIELAKQAARKEAAGKFAGGMAGTATKILLDILLKRKGH